MATTEKRPRIDPETAAMIELVKGKHESFEGFVNDAVGTYLELYWQWRLSRKWHPSESDVTHKWTAKVSKDHEVLITLLQSDLFGFEGDDFRAAFDKAMEYHAARMDEFARDEEMEGD